MSESAALSVVHLRIYVILCYAPADLLFIYLCSDLSAVESVFVVFVCCSLSISTRTSLLNLYLSTALRLPLLSIGSHRANVVVNRKRYYLTSFDLVQLVLDSSRDLAFRDRASGCCRYRTTSGKKLSEHIDEFNKLIGNLENIDVDIDDEDQALMLLTSLPSSYDNFLETLLYGREYLTLEDVLSSLNLRELKKRTDAKDDGDGLYVRGRSDHREKFDIFGHSGLRGLYFEVAEWKSKGDQAESGEASVGIQEKESLAQVCHKRVGHIDEAGLHELEKREGEFWGQHTMEGVIDYVHADIWGPSRVESISGCRSPSTALEKETPNGFMVKTSGELRDVEDIWDAVFNESLMYKDTLKGVGAADSGREVEFEVELQGSRVKPTVDPHTGENPGNEDEEQDEEPQQQNLDNYVLVRDRANRTTFIPARYRDE
nr:retrovirus-related Pol polyprotein from transposon TNT 1-94 [Tanacetum cinerariifolium]